ncbi:hypothetical protein GCM10027436_13740 [Actinophytocola sediminis]
MMSFTDPVNGSPAGSVGVVVVGVSVTLSDTGAAGEPTVLPLQAELRKIIKAASTTYFLISDPRRSVIAARQSCCDCSLLPLMEGNVERALCVGNKQTADCVTIFRPLGFFRFFEVGEPSASALIAPHVDALARNAAPDDGLCDRIKEYLLYYLVPFFIGRLTCGITRAAMVIRRVGSSSVPRARKV